MANYVDVIANLMPWAGSLIPATLTYQNVQKNLGFDTGPAVLVAAVVEGLGFVTVATALDLYELRRSENALAEKTWSNTHSRQDGAFWVSLAGTLVYLAVVLLVNSILDDGDIWHKLTLGLLSIFGILGGLMVALRKHLGERLAAIAKAERELKARSDEDRSKADQLAREVREQAEAREREERQRAHDMEQERLKLEHELRLEKARAESARKLEKLRTDTPRKVSEGHRTMSETHRTISGSDRTVSENHRIVSESEWAGSGNSPDDAETSPDGLKVAGKMQDTPRRWPEVSPDDYGWIAEASAKEIVARYGLSGKDPERVARSWKGYAREAIKANSPAADG